MSGFKNGNPIRSDYDSNHVPDRQMASFVAQRAREPIGPVLRSTDSGHVVSPFLGNDFSRQHLEYATRTAGNPDFQD
ncbi:MAG: hypothetical protein AAGH40_02790 [Verrucomicrobiota bacterium]